MATPTATTQVARTVTASAGMGGSWCGAVPTTGARKSTIQSPIRKTPPRTDSAASTISGTVITEGDSCGWTSLSQRLLVKKVISIRRVM